MPATLDRLCIYFIVSFG